MMRLRKWSRRFRRIWLVVVGVWLSCLMVGSLQAQEEGSGEVGVVTIAGTINNGSSEYVLNAIDRAEKQKDRCLIIEIDTPGGALSDTEDMVKRMMSANVPVVVFVWPKASQAASAGTFITMAAHVAAMAPGSRIGAAHPVSIGLPIGGGDQDKKKKEGEQRDVMMEKVENDTVSFIRGIAKERGRNEDWAEKAVRQSVSITADEALQLKVVDLIADSMDDLLQKIDGREVKIDSKTTVTLKTKGAVVHRYDMTIKQRLLNFLTNPEMLMILLTLGGLGLLMEFYHPGAIFPGVFGGICLLLAFISMRLLPVNAVGLILLLVGIGLFIAEVYVSSYGLLGIGGAVLFLAGGILLVDPASESKPFYIEPGQLSVGWGVLIPMVLTMAALFFYIGFYVIRSQRKKISTGAEDMIGKVGEARSEINAQGGRVFVRGEIWIALCEGVIPAGAKVEVVRLDGLKVFVKKAD